MSLKYVFIAALACGLSPCDEPRAPANRVGMTLPDREAGPPVASTSGSWQLHFSPHGGCEQMVIALINGATKSIRIQAYGFTSVPIASAIVKKKVEGLDVQGVFDRSDRTAKNSQIGMLKDAGIPVYIDARHPIMHVKAMIIDGTWIELGSYNYTTQAENNAEDCYEEESAEKASAFNTQWEDHKTHAEAL